MRNLIGFVVGLYLTVALVVFGAAAWSFSTEPRWQGDACARDWMPWAGWRAIAWPKTYFDDADKIPPNDLPGWLMVQYDPWPGQCS
jgi:hypothetical protein